MRCRTSNREIWPLTKIVSSRLVPSFFHHKREKSDPLTVCSNTLSLVSLQILDFGLARHTEAEMTGYVVTRWYRAPEVILNWMHYTQTGKTFTLTHLLKRLPVPRVFLGDLHICLCKYVVKSF